MTRFLTVPFLLGSLAAPAQKLPEKGTTTWSPSDFSLVAPHLFPTTERVHAVITEKGHSKFETYEESVPKAEGASLRMVAIPGGELAITDEKKVKLDPFWISTIEIPWKLYRPFFENDPQREKDGTLTDKDRSAPLVDAISQPTDLHYDQLDAGRFSGTAEFPAMNMTHHSASKFCQWLSAQTGHFYRLPTEAEWEYACRAGSATAYSFGNDSGSLGEYAWFAGNSAETTHPCGQKKPNRWGLHDMHGNVAEWVLDGHAVNFRSSLADGTSNPWKIPEMRYQRILKGGSWKSAPADTMIEARLLSSKELKKRDPQIPRSIWYLTNGQHIGFRVVRPARNPTAEEMHLFWNTEWRAPERNAEEF